MCFQVKDPSSAHGFWVWAWVLKKILVHTSSGESMLELLLSLDDFIFSFSLQDSAATDLMMSKIAIFFNRAWMLRIFLSFQNLKQTELIQILGNDFKCHLGTAGSELSCEQSVFFWNVVTELKRQGLKRHLMLADDDFRLK